MVRSKRMESVQRLVDDDASRAAKAFADAKRMLEEQRRRLDQLTTFRQEYRQQLQTSGDDQGIDAYRLRDYRIFLARIDEAIVQQQQIVQRSEQDVAQRRTQWLQVRGRAQALNKVVDRYRSEERQAEDKRSQRQDDELARTLSLARKDRDQADK